MIGDDQARYQSLERLREAGMACGYQFHVENVETDGTTTRGTIVNRGIAPLYYDAYPAIVADGGQEIRADVSLKYLLPGEQKAFSIPAQAGPANFRIACDRLVDQQQIPFFVQ